MTSSVLSQLKDRIAKLKKESDEYKELYETELKESKKFQAKCDQLDKENFALKKSNIKTEEDKSNIDDALLKAEENIRKLTNNLDESERARANLKRALDLAEDRIELYDEELRQTQLLGEERETLLKEESKIRVELEIECSEFEQQLKKMESTLNEQQILLNESSATLKMKNIDLQKKEKSLEEAVKRLKEFETELHDRNSAVKQLQKNVENLNNNEQGYKNTIKSLESRLKEVESKNENLEGEITKKLRIINRLEG